MTQVISKDDEKKGLLRDLINRRVLRITGFYLGGSWGVLQFLDWIVDRYLLSTLLVDLALTIVISLLPSIVLIAYFHGTPGKNIWKKSEKVFIPLNLIISIFLVLFIFGNKNLSSIGNRITVTNEQGLKIKKIVPKRNAIKKIVMFDFKNRTGVGSLDWIEQGIISMLDIDISQDPFIKTFSTMEPETFKGFYLYRKFKDAGFSKVADAPKLFLKKVADEVNAEYFLTGYFTGTKKNLEFKVVLNVSKDGSVKKEKILKTKNIITLIDDLTLFLKKSLDLPSYKNSEIIDLKFGDMFTESLNAAKLYTKALNVVREKNDNKTAQAFLEKAVKIDPTFTLAYVYLYTAYARRGRTAGLKSVFEKIMKNLYKLPERIQMIVKSGYYTEIKKDPAKAISILNMLVKLYPSDIKSYSQLAFFFNIRGNYKKALTNYKKIIELQPDQYEVYKKIGDVYKNMDDMKSALLYYKKYSEFFPKKKSGLLNMGDVEELSGNFKKAKEYYEKALLLEPDDTTTLLLLAGLDIKSGKFNNAMSKYRELLKSAKNPREKCDVITAMRRLFKLKGEMKNEMKMMTLYFETSREFLAPVQIYVNQVILVNIFLKNGKVKEILKLLKNLKQKFPPSINKIISIGYAKYYIYKGELKKAEASVDDIGKLIKLTGFKQFLSMKNEFLGDIAKKRGDFEKSLEIYKKLLKNDKYRLSIIIKSLQCYIELKNFDEGLEISKRGLRLSPYDPELNYYTALLYLKKNNMDKAGKYLAVAVKGWSNADPQFELADRAKKLWEKVNFQVKNVK